MSEIEEKKGQSPLIPPTSSKGQGPLIPPTSSGIGGIDVIYIYIY